MVVMAGAVRAASVDGGPERAFAPFLRLTCCYDRPSTAPGERQIGLAYLMGVLRIVRCTDLVGTMIGFERDRGGAPYALELERK